MMICPMDIYGVCYYELLEERDDQISPVCKTFEANGSKVEITLDGYYMAIQDCILMLQ